MKTNILKYLSVFAVYFFVDVTYQVAFGIKFAQQVQASAGIADIYATELQNPIYILIWFAIMTVAIVKLAVEPGVAEGRVFTAAFRGFLLGATAYATLALPNGWSLADFPASLVLEIMFEGALFAPVASAATAWWIIRKQARESL